MDLSTSARIRLIACLAISQIIGWGTTFDIISVFATPIAKDLHIERELLYAGPTIFLIVSAIAGPAVGRLVKREGARRVLTIGTIVMAIGVALLSAANHWLVYAIAWGVLGLGGAFGLGPPAFAAVVERDGQNSKRTIGIVLIFAGLSTAVSWPTFTFLQAQIGWRNSLLVGALALAFVALPLVRLGLARVVISASSASSKTEVPPISLDGAQRTLAFVLLATISTLLSVVSVVSFGISPSMIDILIASGATATVALGFASFRSVLGITARIVDVVFGKRGDAVVTSLASALFMLVGVATLGLLAPSPVASLLFVVFYGVGSGVATLARAVLPLNFFSAGEYSVVAGKIQLPQNIGTAFAPLVFSFILSNLGFNAIVVWTLFLLAILCGAILMLFQIKKQAYLRNAKAA